MDDHRADRVGDEREHENEQGALHDAVAEEDDERPDHERGGGHRDDPLHSEQLEARGDPGKLRGDIGSVRDEQRDHRDDRPAHPEPLTNEVRQSLSCDRTHARAHLLDDQEARGREEQEPQQREAVMRAHRGVGRDAARVVAGEAGDDAGPHDREEREDRGAANTCAAADR